jgi:ankyrin repeat protein
MCHEPLLDPVIADDENVYNKNCLIKYFETERGKRSLSPLCEKSMTRNYHPIRHIRTSVLTLITETQGFDQWISELTLNQIIGYKLHQILIECKKIQLLNQDLVNDLELIPLINALIDNDYMKCADLIKQNNYNVTKLWIYVCENKMEQYAIKLLNDDRDQKIDYNYVTNQGTNGLLIACENKMYGLVEKLLEKSDLIHTVSDVNENNALMIICRNNNEPLGLRYIESLDGNNREDFPINQMNNDGDNALMLCCENSMEALGLKLLEFDKIDYNYDNEDENVLSIAFENKLLEILKILLKKSDIDYNYICSYNDLTIFTNICASKISDEVIEWILTHNQPNIDYNLVSEDNSFTALIMACNYNNPFTALKLLSIPGIQIDQVDDQEDTAFICACKNGMKDVVEKMLTMGVNYNHIDKSGNTGLILLCVHEHEEIALMLLDQPNINLNHMNSNSHNAFYCACQSKMIRVIDRMISLGIDYNHIFSNNYSSLMMTCYQPETWACAIRLLDQPNIKITHGSSRHPDELICAVCCTKKEINEDQIIILVNKLLQHGSDCNAVYKNFSVLSIVLKNEYQELGLRLLDQPGINIYQKDTDGCTALTHACEKGLLKIVEKILEIMKVQETDDDENYYSDALIAACDAGNNMIALQLLSHIDEKYLFDDADRYEECDKIINRVNDEAESILMIACYNNMSLVVKKLLEMGCDHNYINPMTGQTALIIACKEFSEKCIDVFIEFRPYCMDFGHEDNNGLSSMSYAMMNKKDYMVYALYKCYISDNNVVYDSDH